MDTDTMPNKAQRRHEAPEIGQMVRRMVRGLVRRAAEGDWEALEALAMLERELPTATSCAIALMQADRGQSARYSYTELADQLGTSRQAVRQRAMRVDTEDTTASYYSDGRSCHALWQTFGGER